MIEISLPVPSHEHWSYPSMKERIESEGYPFASHLCLHYIGSDGERTIRTVKTTHALSIATDIYIVGHCELRNEKRAFRASRVTAAYVLESGSAHISFLSWLRSRVPSRHSKLPTGPTGLVVQRTGSTHLAVQTSRGLVYMSPEVYNSTNDQIAAGAAIGATQHLAASLPSLSHDLLQEIIEKFCNYSAQF